MAKTNVSSRGRMAAKTHEGGRGRIPNAEEELQRTLSTCLLFENTFYEGGDSIANRLVALAEQVDWDVLERETRRAKFEAHLRHAPLWMAVNACKFHKGQKVGNLITDMIVRVDEIPEAIAMYYRANGNKKVPLAKQLKVGIANSFYKFDEYQFAKYNRDTEIKLRDVAFMVHPDAVDVKKVYPKTHWPYSPAINRKGYKRGATYRHEGNLVTKIINGELQTPDTWEVAISAAKGKDEKRAEWTRLLKDNRLGALALIRNLRNMDNAGVDRKLIMNALNIAKGRRLLPYQFIAAWKYAPQYARGIETAMLRGMEGLPRLHGQTALIVDVSGSMDWQLSGGKTNRIDAACGLAIIINELSDDCRVWTFSNREVEVPAARGFGLYDAIDKSQHHGGTALGTSVNRILPQVANWERVIVVTDEQANDFIPIVKACKNQYLVNVAPYKIGLETGRQWIRINGFSQQISNWIAMEERDRLFS